MKTALLSLLLLSSLSLLSSAQSWNTLGSGMDSYANVMFEYDGKLLVAGIDSAGGVAVNALAAWNGTSWSDFGNAVLNYGAVTEMCIYKDTLYIAGGFGTINGDTVNNIAKWNGTDWVALGDGVNGSVRCMAVYNNELYVGGGFYNVAGNNQSDNIARWNGTSWNNCANGLFYPPNDIAVYNGKLYAGGEDNKSLGEPLGFVPAWNGTQWDSTATFKFNGDVETLEVYNGNLYAGGDFDFDSTNYVGFYDGTSWHPCGTGADDIVYDLQVYNNELYVVGGFYKMDEIITNNIARWNGTGWDDCLGGTDYDTYELATYNNELIVSGYFDHVGNNMAARYIARWETNSTGIDETILQDNINIYPNPCAGKFSVTLPSEMVTVTILNLLGQKIFETKTNSQRCNIDIGNTGAGVYLLQVQGKGGVSVQRLVKE